MEILFYMALGVAVWEAGFYLYRKYMQSRVAKLETDFEKLLKDTENKPLDK